MEDNKDVQVTEETTAEEIVKEETAKSYTQEDIDNSYNAGVKKGKKELEKSEDYQSYLEWKKTNQNDSERITELETNILSKDNEIMDLKAQLKLKDSDVKPEFVKFVKNEVLSMVNDTIDFETALKNFKKDNSQYFGETVVKKVQSSPNLNNGATKTNTVDDIFNNMIRNA